MPDNQTEIQQLETKLERLRLKRDDVAGKLNATARLELLKGLDSDIETVEAQIEALKSDS